MTFLQTLQIAHLVSNSLKFRQNPLDESLIIAESGMLRYATMIA